MADSAQPLSQVSIPLRFLDLLLKKFTGTVKHLIWHVALLLAAIVFDFVRLGRRAFIDHAWEAVVPIVWLLCAMVVLHSIQAAIGLIRYISAETTGKAIEVEGLVFTADAKTKFQLPRKPPKLPRFLHLKVWTTASVPIAMSALCSVAVWLLAKAPIPIPTPPPIPTPAPTVGLFMDCIYEGFPLQIPRGTTAHVLRVHPSIARSGIESHAVPLLYVEAPPDKERVWPSDKEAPPLPEHAITDAPIRTASALNCTIRKYGNGTADLITIPMEFSDKYDVLIEPLDSSGTFDRFSFHIINACYANLKPGTYDGGGVPAILANFPKTATLRMLGESSRKPVPLTVSFREHQLPIIFLQSVYRHWNDLLPCY
jgi:hypothetical protein